MANTFSQIYIQVVFAVQNRNALIQTEWEEELNKYITGVVQNKGRKTSSRRILSVLNNIVDKVFWPINFWIFLL